ncbi:MAG TPA: hypothetical protein VJ063_21140 [Verrucomicrobiae bacterium]|nr:hypothetical protein [Verrucomicrobiae bacterium]
MQPEIDQNLARVIHQELRKLPPLKAPEALLGRVLAGVRLQQALPWWRKSIWQWPNAARTTFFVVLAVMITAIMSSHWWAGDVAAKGVEVLSDSTQPLVPLSNAFLVLWRTLLQNVVIFGLAFSGMLYLLCLGAGTMFVRFALRRS